MFHLLLTRITYCSVYLPHGCKVCRQPEGLQGTRRTRRGVSILDHTRDGPWYVSIPFLLTHVSHYWNELLVHSSRIRMNIISYKELVHIILEILFCGYQDLVSVRSSKEPYMDSAWHW